MISNYYVLVALAHEWKSSMAGASIADAYSQSADELSLVLESVSDADGPAVSTLRMSTAAPLRYLLLGKGSGRAKRNTADVLDSIRGATIQDVDVVEGDRIVRFYLDGNRQLLLVLFGSAANAYVIGSNGEIVDAFQSAAKYLGKRVPTRSVSVAESQADFAERWKKEATGTFSCGQVLARVEPLFNRFLADEVVARSGIDIKTRAKDVDGEAIRAFFEGVGALRTHFGDGAWIYWADGRPERLTLFESVQLDSVSQELESKSDALTNQRGNEVGDVDDSDGDSDGDSEDDVTDSGLLTRERFDSVSSAVSVFVRRTLAVRSLGDEHTPVLKKLTSAKKRAERRLAELQRELSETPRSDKYEKYGHVLMAQATSVTRFDDPFVTEDMFDGGDIAIPVDTSTTLIDNANRYYEKAKRAKLARESAESRLSGARKEASEIVALFDQVAAVSSLDEWKKLAQDNEVALRPYMEQASRSEPVVPFRQFDLGNGYTVWVGKNAKQNELLSSKAARKFDLWFHARGVPGSHVVLRLPNKNTEPDGRVVEAAASIAAYYSKARGGSMVPVIVAEAKFVRKPRGAAPGSVVVEKERVLLVDPGLPK